MKKLKKFAIPGVILVLLLSIAAAAYASNITYVYEIVDEPQDPYFKRAMVTFTFDGVYRDINHCTAEDYRNRTCITPLTQAEENLEYLEHITGGKPYVIFDEEDYNVTLNQKLAVDCQPEWQGDNYSPEWETQFQHYCDRSRKPIELALSSQNLHLFVDEQGEGSGSSYLLIKNIGEKPVVLRHGNEELRSEEGVYAVSISNNYHLFDYDTGKKIGAGMTQAVFGGDNSYQVAFKLFGKKWGENLKATPMIIEPGQILAVRYDYKIKPTVGNPFEWGESNDAEWNKWNAGAGNFEGREVSDENQPVAPKITITFSFYETL